jgi:hypothetical protein
MISWRFSERRRRMAKKVEKAAAAPAEEMEAVELEQEEKDPDEGLQTVPASEIEVQETEPEVEEGEEPEQKRNDPATEAILQGFNLLREELRGRDSAPVVAAAAAAPGESDEEFGAKVNEELFKDNPYGTLQKAIKREARKLLESEVGPMMGTIMESAFENAEFRLKNDERDGPVYRQYEDEIKKTLKTLTPAQQKNPQVLKAVFERVKSLHVDEIVEMKVAEKMKGKAPAAVPRKPVSEGGSTVMPSSGAKRVMVPKSQMERLRKLAGQQGVPVEVLVERLGTHKF